MEEIVLTKKTILEDFGKRRNSGGACIHTPIAGSLSN